MERLSIKNRIFVGMTLFSMFFGAGNLIFPPFMGALAGEKAWLALFGFVISAIGLPVLGVAAVALSDGLENLAKRVHPLFSSVFTLLIYLSIGPCLAIPRTAGTSFEMAVLPYISENGNKGIFLAVYSIGFFALAFFLAQKPEMLKERLGKYLAPILLILIGALFIGCLVKSEKGYGDAAEIYQSHAAVQGFLDGYQTMDTIAALNFGLVIAMNIRAAGVRKEKDIAKETVTAGMIAGVLMLIVYGVLTWIGSAAGNLFGAGENGAQTLSQMSGYLFGSAGKMILGAIFFIACLNTCTGLICCCGEYFHTICPGISYRRWVLIFSGISAVIANAGLTAILRVSVPVLQWLYPMAIMLIVLAFLHHRIEKWRYVYPWVIGLTGISSAVHALDALGCQIPAVTVWVERIPLYDLGLGWILPAAAGMIIGIIWSRIRD